MYQRTQPLCVVGDIHGDADRLSRSLDFLLGKPEAHIIFTGDYINRGPNSRLVLDLLIDARQAHAGGMTLLRGNHEDALLSYLNGGNLSEFAAHGGLATVKSYLGVVQSGALEEFRNQYPTSHRAFLETLESWYEDDEVLVSHTGFEPTQPSARTAEALYAKGNSDLFHYHGPWPKPLTICGHYIQGSGQPYISPHFICVDTGCGTVPESPLTVLSLPERKVNQF